MSSRPGSVLSRLCSNAQRLIIAAPYIKADTLTRVLSDVGPAASIICVTRWNPQDLAVGASDTACRTIVTERGGSFRLHPSLHAKYYRIDDTVLIGSANLTSSAMGWSPQPNLEILCRAGDDFDACAFQRELLNEAREISDAEFARWEAIARISTRSIPTVADGQPLLDTWRPATREPRHLEFVYQGRKDLIASFDEQQAAQQDIQALLIPPGLTNEQVRTWAAACLLAAHFTNAVIRLHNLDVSSASRSLGRTYRISPTEARRDMETVQNWLAFLAPEMLPEGYLLGKGGPRATVVGQK